MKSRRTARRAVFLDRDGVIVREVDYLSRISQLKIIPGVAAAIKKLRAAGFKIVVVTNQSGVARGKFSLAQLKRIHRELKRRLADSGAQWDALYFSPHHPDSGHPMRKPGTGMLLAAKRRFGLDLETSYLVGDTTTDVMTARNAGCASILVRTGYAGRDGRHDVKPDKRCADLAAAADWIVLREARNLGAPSSARGQRTSKAG